MISKCPECGRSYPTHHGSICKLCAAKSSQVAAPAAAVQETVKAAEPVMASTAATPRPVTSPAISPTAPKIRPQIEDQGQVFNPMLGGNSEAKPAAGQSDKEADSAAKICPQCSAENDPSDAFCRQCEKMLITSAGGKKLDDYQLTQLKGTIPDQLAKLKKLGITTSLQLLDKGSSPTKRKTLSIKTGISETFLQRLIHQADLLRIPSLQPDQAYLLEGIGINSFKLLERKTVKDIMELISKQKAALQAKKIMVLPGEKTVGLWLTDIKQIEKVVS